VADNKTAEGRAKNRRVEIEVVGTRANQVIFGLLKKAPVTGLFLCPDVCHPGIGPWRKMAIMTETTER
jgi:hypothetical protein